MNVYLQALAEPYGSELGILVIFVHIIIIIIIGGFVSDFSGFCFLPCFVECNPYTLDSHGVGCLALLLNLALLTTPS